MNSLQFPDKSGVFFTASPKKKSLSNRTLQSLVKRSTKRQKLDKLTQREQVK